MNRQTTFLKTIFFLPLLWIPFAQAEWRITFSQEKLIDSPYNRKIIAALLTALPNYPSHANPTLQFVFHQNRNSQERWNNLSEHIPALKHRQYEIYNSPDVDALSIYLKQKATDDCPAKIIIKDPKIPSQSVYFPVYSSGVFILSEQAEIEISQQEGKLQIALYDRQRDKLQMFNKLSLRGDETQEALSIGIFAPSTELNTRQIKSLLQTTWQENIGEIRQKAMALSSIPASLLHFEKSEKKSTTNACFLHLKPSFNPSQY